MSEPAPRSEFVRLLRSRSETLACSESVDELLEQVADGDGREWSEHQLGCVHCQAALREFDDLWTPVREYGRRPVMVPQRLAAAVTAQVDKLVADVWYTLQITDGGLIQIAARVVATIARDTARLVPGVRVALGRSTDSKLARLVEQATLGHRQPDSAVGVLGRTAVVNLALAVTYGDPVDEVAHEVQRRVMAELRKNVGLQSVTVNVTVDDVLAPLADDTRPRAS